MKKWAALLCGLLLLAGVLSACTIESVSEHESRIQNELTAALGQPETTGAKAASQPGNSTDASQAETVSGSRGETVALPGGRTTTKAAEQPGVQGSTPSPAAKPTQGQQEQPPAQIRVTISASCKEVVGHKDLNLKPGVSLPADGVILGDQTVTLRSGQTVFDALKLACAGQKVELSYQGSAFGKYVKGIGPISEKECGKQSGWIYQVNGVQPSKSADSYKLKNGDVVQWNYVAHA